MSKASEWARLHADRPAFKGTTKDTRAHVSDSGVLVIGVYSAELSIDEPDALALARWILDTFGEQ